MTINFSEKAKSVVVSIANQSVVLIPSLDLKDISTCHNHVWCYFKVVAWFNVPVIQKTEATREICGLLSNMADHTLN